MPAQVRSFETIERVRVAIAKFGHRSTEGLDELSGEIRRVIDWVEHDRPAYWKSRVQRAYDEVGEAKAALHRCLMYPINDETPSCADERAALKKAEAHLVYCREKQERVREWAQKLRHELHEYTGRVSKLRRLTGRGRAKGRGVAGTKPADARAVRRHLCRPDHPGVGRRPADGGSTVRGREGGLRMKPCDLDTGAIRIRRGLDELILEWEEAAEDWNDSLSETVFKEHLEPMTPVVKSALDAVGRMRALLHEAQRDLES